MDRRWACQNLCFRPRHDKWQTKTTLKTATHTLFRTVACKPCNPLAAMRSARCWADSAIFLPVSGKTSTTKHRQEPDRRFAPLPRPSTLRTADAQAQRYTMARQRYTMATPGYKK